MPFEERTEFILERARHAGSLEIPADTVQHPKRLVEGAPLLLEVRLDRRAVLTPLEDVATVLIGSFGTSDAAMAQALRPAPKHELRFINQGESTCSVPIERVENTKACFVESYVTRYTGLSA